MLALSVQAIALLEANAASYGITVPAGKQYLAAFHFQSQTISQVFPAYSVPYGTQVFVWNNSSQSYTQQTYDDLEEAWHPNPNFVLYPGDVFFIRNNSDSSFYVTIYGDEPTSSINFSLNSGASNGIGLINIPAAYNGIECTCPIKSGYTYTHGYPYTTSTGDYMAKWDPNGNGTYGDWYTISRVSVNLPHQTFSWGGGYCAEGTFEPGEGAFFFTSDTRTWTQPATPEACGVE